MACDYYVESRSEKKKEANVNSTFQETVIRSA